MTRYDIKELLEEHLIFLQEEAKKNCSGEDLRNITAAISMTVQLLFQLNISHHNVKE